MSGIRVLAIAMDFDGTILDSNSLKAACFGQVFAPFGQTAAQFASSYHFRQLSQPRLEKITSIATKLGLNLSNRELEKLSELFGNLVMDQISTCSLVPGVTEFFEWVGDEWPLYICSATPLGELERILESMGINSHFKKIFGYPTTKEEALVEIATSLGCPCSRILMIGDADADEKAALNVGAGFHLIGDDQLASYRELTSAERISR